MRKYVFICLMALVAVAFTACDRNPNAPKQKVTIDLVVNQNDWEFDTKANRFFCHFDVPALTADAYNYGEISISREYNSGKANVYQVALPETSYKMEEETDDAGNVTNTFYYQQLIDYAVGIQWVEVTYTISDYFYPTDESGKLIKPESMLFRLQLTY